MGTLLGLVFGDVAAAFWSTNFSLTLQPGIPSRDLSKVQDERTKTEKRLKTQDPKDLVNWLYGELNCLDTKANSIVQLNAIGIAVVVFLIQLSPAAVAASSPFKVVVIVSLALLTWSILTLTSISLVFWSRTKDLTDQPENADAHDRVNVLIYLSDCRSKVLRSSAVRALIAFLVLATLVIVLVLAR